MEVPETSHNLITLCLLYQVPLTTAPEGGNNISGRTQPVNPVPPGFSVLNHQIHVAQLQPGAIPRNMVDILCFLAPPAHFSFYRKILIHSMVLVTGYSGFSDNSFGVHGTHGPCITE